MNSISVAAVIPCGDYGDENVYRALKSGIDALGGIGAFADPSEKILVKPNFLSPAAPEAAVTTHPAVTGALFRILSEAGFFNVSYGDSPGHGSPEQVSRKSGTDFNAEKYGIPPADMKTEIKVSFPEGRYAGSFYLCRGAYEADAIISVSKMKTHQLEKITGAVKNMYGTICGPRKAAGHVSFPNASAFARMLCDLHRLIPPRLNIIDGITAMEGNGPGSGTPVEMGVLIVSADPVAADSIFACLTGLDPALVPTCLQGELSGIGHYKPENIKVLLGKPSECQAESGGKLPEESYGRGEETAACTKENRTKYTIFTNQSEEKAAACAKQSTGISIVCTKQDEEKATALRCENRGTPSHQTPSDAREPSSMYGSAKGADQTSGPYSFSEVSFDELFLKYGNPDFDVDREGSGMHFLSGLSAAATRFMKKPVIDPALCVKCGVCVSHCPVPGKAVFFADAFRSKPPVYNYRKCIRCYCCQEMCPEHAIHT